LWLLELTIGGFSIGLNVNGLVLWDLQVPSTWVGSPFGVGVEGEAASCCWRVQSGVSALRGGKNISGNFSSWIISGFVQTTHEAGFGDTLYDALSLVNPAPVSTNKMPRYYAGNNNIYTCRGH
jgi:hypothetical protein